MTKEELQREIELKLNAYLPHFAHMDKMSIEQEKQQTINTYYNQVHDLYYKNKKSPRGSLKNYNTLTELEKIEFINENIFVDDMVMVLLEKPSNGQKFSLMTRLVFNDFVKYRDFDFYQKYHLLFDL